MTAHAPMHVARCCQMPPEAMWAAVVAGKMQARAVKLHA